MPIEVRGNDKDSVKEERLLDFAAGKFKILISKAKICGYGMNFELRHSNLRGPGLFV